GDGTVTATIGSNRAQDAAGNGNAASTNLDNSVLLDTVAPASEASSPAYSNASDSTIRVDYAAFDSSSQGSGVKRVELWVKVPGGDWELLDTDTAPLADHIDYTPADGDGRYRFYTIAVDNAGNREIAPGEPDAVTEKVDTNTLRDTVAPDPTLSTPPALTNDATPEIAGTGGILAETDSHSADNSTVHVRVLDGDGNVVHESSS